MGRRKTGVPPERRRTNKINMVAAAVELAGGPTVVARLCGVSRQSVYLWIKEWKVDRLVDALKLSRASGISIEKFTNEIVDIHPEKKLKGDDK
jgi:transposase-like protein